MDDEWVLKQVLKNRKRLREVFESDIKEVENGKRITDLPSDVIALCLSYIDVDDIRNCWNTCKSFSNVIKEKKHFWRAITKRQLLTIFGRYLPIIDIFDPFSSIIEEDLKDQFEWLFRSHWIRTFYNGTILERHSSNNWVLQVSQDFVSSYESPPNCFDEYYGIEHIKFNDGTKVSNYRGTTMKFTQRNEQLGAIWDGEGICEEDDVDEYYYAHGKGTWAFDDGTIVDGFADMGEFVYHANFEEWKKISGKNSTSFSP